MVSVVFLSPVRVAEARILYLAAVEPLGTERGPWGLIIALVTEMPDVPVAL